MAIYRETCGKVQSCV